MRYLFMMFATYVFFSASMYAQNPHLSPEEKDKLFAVIEEYKSMNKFTDAINYIERINNIWV